MSWFARTLTRFLRGKDAEMLKYTKSACDHRRFTMFIDGVLHLHRGDWLDRRWIGLIHRTSSAPKLAANLPPFSGAAIYPMVKSTNHSRAETPKGDRKFVPCRPGEKRRQDPCTHWRTNAPQVHLRLVQARELSTTLSLGSGNEHFESAKTLLCST
jgi:hypothetical protein